MIQDLLFIIQVYLTYEESDLYFSKWQRRRKGKKKQRNCASKEMKEASNFNWSTWMFDIMAEDHTRQLLTEYV